jgi:hypothetical protein
MLHQGVLRQVVLSQAVHLQAFPFLLVQLEDLKA